MRVFIKALYLLLILLTIHIVTSYQSIACTRVVYHGNNNLVLTARSMDWRDPIPANIWIFPRGMQRNGAVGPQSYTWTSKYGSVIASCWDIASSDGMNEKGMVANLLWLVESKYPPFDPKGTKKGLAISLWAQFILDNYATVEEAVVALQKEPFVVVSANIPGTERFATVHLSISDASGDNAIFEYIEGKLVIHHSREYNTMTNSPVFDQQLALNSYWKSIPGTVMLPGTNRAADRFVRASFYIDAIPKTDDPHVAVASVFSVIRNCSVPLGITTPNEPNISSTRWRSVSDQKNLIYYFETTLTPNTFWVNFKNVDFKPGAPVKKLSVANNETYAGDAVGSFKDSKPFIFAGL